MSVGQSVSQSVCQSVNFDDSILDHTEGFNYTVYLINVIINFEIRLEIRPKFHDSGTVHWCTGVDIKGCGMHLTQ